MSVTCWEFLCLEPYRNPVVQPFMGALHPHATKPTAPPCNGDVREETTITTENLAGDPRSGADDGAAPHPSIYRTLIESSGLTALPKEPPGEAIEDVFKKLTPRLPELSPVQRQLLQSEVSKALMGLKVHGASTIVATAFGAHSEAGQNPEGRGLAFRDPEPWTERVDGNALIGEMTTFLERHVILPVGAALAITLWAIYTFAFDLFDYSPILAITSPVKRCGKTRLLHIVNGLVRKPLAVSHVTTAALFRSIELHAPTVLIDEFDTFLPGNEDLRGILNSGHFKRTAQVIRCTGDSHEPVPFSTWAPKLVAGIGALPGTVDDRSVKVVMRRKLPHETVEATKRPILEQMCTAFARRAARWVNDNAGKIKGIEPQVPEALHDRAVDNWTPLLALAAVAGGDWPRRAGEAAEGLSTADENDLGPEGLLLRDIRDTFGSMGAERLETATILSWLVEMEERPWAEYRNGKAMSANQLADALLPFSIKPRKIRFSSAKTTRGYELEDFREAFARYLPSSAEQPEQAERRSISASSSDVVPPSQSEQQVGISADCFDVPGVPAVPGEIAEVNGKVM